jgi:DNA-binding response OmpR family regulator
MTTKRRVLVLDDEMLVAMMLEDMLIDLDFDVVGPFAALEEALAAAKEQQLDVAIIDLNLGRGVLSTPVAEVLRERGVPFLLATGYGASEQTDALGHSGLLGKPFSTGDVEAALGAILG